MLDFQVAIFDMDGLMVDTEIHYREGWKAAARRLQVPLKDEIVDSWVGKGVPETTRYLMELTGDPEIIRKMRREREAYFYEQLKAGRVRLKKGLKELLNFFQEHGVRLAAASSTYSQRGRAIFEHFQLFEEFEIIVFGDQVQKVKPAPDLYLKVLDYFSEVDKSQVMVLEDSTTGARAAYHAGLSVFLVPDSSFYNRLFDNPPENVIRQFFSLDEVRQFLEQ